jgi:hypothetical protein
MSRSIRLTVVVAVAVLASALGAGTAVGASFQFSPGGAITGTSLGAVTFSGSGITITCELTLSGTVTSRVVEKRAGASYGAVTSVSIGRCSGGSAAVSGLPWPVTYNAILGSLPDGVTAVSLTVNDASFALTFSGITCTYGGDVTSLLSVSGRNPYTTTLYAIPSNRVPLVRGSFLCPSTGSMSGTFAISPTQTVTRIE